MSDGSFKMTRISKGTGAWSERLSCWLRRGHDLRFEVEPPFYEQGRICWRCAAVVPDRS